MATSLFPLPRVTLPLLLLLSTLGLTWGSESPETPADRAQVVHVLNRITFGPRPGDVDMVQKMGLHNYIEQQLHPETIDDSAVEQIVAQFEILQMTPAQLANLYADDLQKILKRAKKNAEKELAANPAGTPPPATAADMAMQSTSPATSAPPATAAPPVDKDKSMMAEGQDKMETQTAPPPELAKLTPAQRLAEASTFRSVAAIGQLEQAKLVRAINSQRQLQEVLADFWNNHFNVDVKKKACRVLKVADDRDVIRPHLWGKFRDLLEADAKSPAMLVYLDNNTNSLARDVGPMEQMMMQQMQDATAKKMLGDAAPPSEPVDPAKAKTKKMGGINENYAREIMELHTLGVDGGYTQQDVQEVARCFTGWSVDRQTGEFAFRKRQHDDGAKVVLGHNIPAGGGMKDGEMVLDILASSPATAHHIAYQLSQRFVADNPPPALVDRVAGVYTATGGDLRAVTEAILTSPEFVSASSYGNKIKSPLEFTVSAVRASGATIIAQGPPPFDKAQPAIEGGAILGKGADRMSQRPRQSLNFHLYELGEPLFACSPPTGYKEDSSVWVSPGALIERLNFAMALTGQKVSDIRFDSSKVLGNVDVDKPDAVLDQCLSVLLSNNVSDSTRKVLKETALPAAGEGQTVNPNKLIALIIGSPEFQRK